MYTLKLVGLVLSYFLFSNWLYSQCQITDFPSISTNDYKDIDDDGPSSSDSDFIELNGNIFFSADDGFSGTELWKIDALTNEIEMVKDINSGASSSFPTSFQELNGKIVFVAQTSDYGSEIWITDGTNQGTQLLKDIFPGIDGSHPSEVEKSGNVIFFSARNSNNNHELWRTDGTEAGTSLVKDINVNGSSSPRHITTISNNIVFSAFENTIGNELWISDGTEAGTNLVRDIIIGSSPSFPYGFASDGTVAYFSALDGIHGAELWKTDGTTAGTTIVTDLTTGSLSSSIGDEKFIYNGEVYFSGSDGISGSELWKSDGNTTTLVKDINLGSGGSFPSTFVEFNNMLYFVANDGVNARQIWHSDGTTTGTMPLAQPNQATNYFSPHQLTVSDNFIYFAAYSSIYGFELWRTDGTVGGTEFLGDIAQGDANSDPAGIITFGDDAYTNATDQIHGYELWKYDDGDQTLEMQADINAFKADVFLGPVECFEDNLSFVFGTDFRGPTIDQIDLNTNTTSTVVDTLGDLKHIFEYYGKLNGIYYFKGLGSTSSAELWRSDGTDAGTYLVKDIDPNGSSRISNVTFIEDKIYFSASNGQDGIEPWVSDGTAAGTFQLADITPGVTYSQSFQFVGGLSSVFFIVDNTLWATDGTQQGTIQLTNFSTFRMVPFLDGILFIGGDPSLGSELHYSEGTSASTVLIKDISPTSSSNPIHLTVVGNRAYFSANQSVSGAELWVTDGTASGTNLVKVIDSNSSTASIDEMIAFQNGVVFVATDEMSGQEIWKSDGTATGTEIILDIVAGPESSFPNNLVTNDEVVYFKQGNPFGDNIWQTDCTAGGTIQISNFSSCTAGNNYNNDLILCNDKLYITTVAGNSRREVFDVLCDSSDNCLNTQVNTWTGPSNGIWQQTPFYWNKSIPTYCDDVIIPAGNNVIIDDTKTAIGRTLDVELGASLESLINAELDIRN